MNPLLGEFLNFADFLGTQKVPNTGGLVSQYLDAKCIQPRRGLYGRVVLRPNKMLECKVSRRLRGQMAEIRKIPMIRVFEPGPDVGFPSFKRDQSGWISIWFSLQHHKGSDPFGQT